MTRAAQEYDGGKGVFMPDWELVLRFVKVLELKNANALAQKKEEVCQEVFRFHSASVFAARPPSPEEDIEIDRATEETIDDADEGADDGE